MAASATGRGLKLCFGFIGLGNQLNSIISFLSKSLLHFLPSLLGLDGLCLLLVCFRSIMVAVLVVAAKLCSEASLV